MADPTSAAQLSLLDFSSDLLSHMFAFLCGDERSLVAASAVCKAFRDASRTSELWVPALLSFFGCATDASDLPPDDSLRDFGDPRQSLSEQVVFARRLGQREAALRCFQARPSRLDTSAWRRRLDDQVAEAQIAFGMERARPGFPNYGAISGAYKTMTSVHGSWIKSVHCNSVAQQIGIEGSTITVWEKIVGPPVVGSNSGGSTTYDYEALAAWRDFKLSELAALVEPGDGRAGPATAAPRVTDETNQISGTKEPCNVHLFPKVLAGQYGGLFEFGFCYTSIGNIAKLVCTADGASIEDYSEM